MFKETASGAKLDRAERRKVMALAQRREIDAVLVTELSRWGRSTLDLLHTLEELEARRVSLIALNGLAFDLATPHGRMLATILAGIAELRARADPGADPLRHGGRQGARQAARPPARPAAEVGPPGAEGAGSRRAGPQLPPDRPRAGTEQEHRRRHRQTDTCRISGIWRCQRFRCVPLRVNPGPVLWRDPKWPEDMQATDFSAVLAGHASGRFSEGFSLRRAQ